MPQIAIIGAGPAGLSAALYFRQHTDFTVTLYEKSRGVGGRATTRRNEEYGYLYDHGAQYFKTETPLADQLTRMMPEAPVDINRPVWTFDHVGVIREGDPVQNAHPKWAYPRGISYLFRQMAEQAQATAHYQVRIERLVHTQGRWALYDTQGNLAGEADVVLLTPPGPQTFDILHASDFAEATRQSMLNELARSTYRRCWTVVFGFTENFRFEEFPYYALVNSDKRHAISWVAFEHNKIGHAPEEHGLVIAQMSDHWSTQNWEHDKSIIIQMVNGMVTTLLKIRLDDYHFVDTQRWLYALPDTLANPELLNASRTGLYFAGDYLTGGRVHLAMECGWNTASQIALELQHE